jgi:hypothetical protein
MIKSFKDFDKDKEKELNKENVFNSKNIIVPKLISDDSFFIKISRIIWKKLDNYKIGDFCIHPTVVNINGIDGIYFYDYNNPSINIVICRNTHVKQAYFFKEFNLDGNNVADLVLSSETLGFSSIIDKLISHISSKPIKEGLIYEWVEDTGTYSYSDADVSIASKFSLDVRQFLVDYLDTPNGTPKYNNFYKLVTNSYANGDMMGQKFVDEFTKLFGVKYSPTGKVKNVLRMFHDAVTGATKYKSDLNVLLTDVKMKQQNNNMPQDPDDIVIDENVDVNAKTYVRSAQLQKEIDKSTIEYKEAIEDITDFTRSMCRYVKNHGKLTDDESSVFKRGLIITGSAGIGKSKHVEDVLKEENMDKNIDYFELGSGNTSAKNLFTTLYEFNGKLIILDDSADMFEGKYNLPLWKLALDTNTEKNYITYNGPTTGANFYDPNKKDKYGRLPTRQQKYFLEIGQSSIEEKTKFKQKMEKELWSKYTIKSMTPDEYDDAKKEISRQIDDAWFEHESDKEPLIPKSFKYTGAVIIISNESRESLIDRVTKGHWEAIKGRFNNVDVNPMAQAVWETIKEKLIEQRDNSNLLDAQRIIPKDYIDLLIEEVERLIDFPMYNNMSWRLITDDMSRAFRGPTGIKRWKRILKTQMNTKI